jgi:hypothetical protein
VPFSALSLCWTLVRWSSQIGPLKSYADLSALSPTGEVRDALLPLLSTVLLPLLPVLPL